MKMQRRKYLQTQPKNNGTTQFEFNLESFG